LTNGIEPLAKQSERNPRRLNMRAVVIGLIEITLSILLLWIIFSHINLTNVKSRLADLTIVGAMLVGALIALHAILSAVRWQLLISHFGGTMKLGPAISAVLIERFVNQAVPSPVGGDGARFVELMRNGQNMRVGAYSIVIDRLFALGGIFGVVTIMLPLTPLVIKSEHIFNSILAIAVVPVLSNRLDNQASRSRYYSSEVHFVGWSQHPGADAAHPMLSHFGIGPPYPPDGDGSCRDRSTHRVGRCAPYIDRGVGSARGYRSRAYVAG